MPGLRDEHALEAALARARQRRSYDPAADPATLAAAYGHGLTSSHPFNDGNKRIGFVTMAVFLGLNEHEIEAPEAEVIEVMVALAAGAITEDELAAWARSRIVPASRPESG